MTGPEIVATLARVRKDRCVPMRRLAERLRITAATICRWEGGGYPAALDLAAAWADALGYDLVAIPKTGQAPSELADLVAALAALHTTAPDSKEMH